MNAIDRSTGNTTIDPITSDIYRISTPIAPDIIPGGFTFNQYLIVDKEPLLFHTGPVHLFPAITEILSKVIPINTLRYIAFSHFESDECGSLNQWLEAAPDAQPLCGEIAAMISINDIAIRSPKIMKDYEIYSLGTHQIQWLDAAHLPHGWDCGYLFELQTKTLFCGDLLTQPGNEHAPLIEADILEASEMMRHQMDYYAHGSNQKELFKKLADLRPQILACMHGSAWKGDGYQMLCALSEKICPKLTDK